MSLRFQCPNCKSIRAVNRRLLGRKTQCPDCGAEVQVPDEAELERQRRERELRRSEAQRKSEAATIVIAEEVIATAESIDEDGELDEAERIAAEEKALAAATTSFTRPRPAASQDMDMTPMVDVTFLLLIFFMITASFSVQKSIQRPAQKSEDPSVTPVQREEEDNPDLVTVQVDEFNAYNVITVDWDRVVGSKQDLIVALADAHAGGSSGRQPSKLLVQAHEDSMHSAVIAALDAGREARFESFEVSTVEQFD